MTTKKHSSAREVLKYIACEPFGDFVRSIREDDEISQSELARRMKVSRQFINSVEHNKTSVSVQVALKFAKALELPHEAFVEICLNDLLRRAGINKVVHLESKAA